MKFWSAPLVLVLLAYSLGSCGTGSFKDDSFYVRGNCKMCKDRLEAGVKKVNGVAQAKYNVKSETLKVTYDSTITDRATIEKYCAEIGHGTESYPMNEKNHEQLPECCKVTHHSGKH